jgi:RNA polymerase sigma factor (sigma-70 family)
MDASQPQRSLEPATEMLVRQVQGGDLGPFGSLYTRIAPALFAWASLRIPRHLRGNLEPEELVQEVWCRALDRISTFDPVRSFRYWIFRIAANTLLENLRRYARGTRSRPPADGHHPRSPTDDPDQVPAMITTVSRRVSRDEAVHAFVEEVGRFTDEDKKLLLYRGLEGRSHSEVAERLGISVEAAVKRWQRLRERLRHHPLPAEMLADD